MTRQMFALTSDQGTAMHETALCSECFTDENKLAVAIVAGEDESGRDFEDCTGNDALQCRVCHWPDDWTLR